MTESPDDYTLFSVRNRSKKDGVSLFLGGEDPFSMVLGPQEDRVVPLAGECVERMRALLAGDTRPVEILEIPYCE